MIRDKDDEVKSLPQGINYAIGLHKEGHTVECWRLLNKLLAISLQYHGINHQITMQVEYLLTICKRLLVWVRQQNDVFFMKLCVTMERSTFYRGPLKSQGIIVKRALFGLMQTISFCL